MCLFEKSAVSFEPHQAFRGYKVFLVDRNGLLVSPFQASTKIPFKFNQQIEWKESPELIHKNIGFYSFLDFIDAEHFVNIEGAGYAVNHGYFLALDVILLNVTHFGMNNSNESCLISKKIIVQKFSKLVEFIKVNNNSYFTTDAKSIVNMDFDQYNDYVDSFKDYKFYEMY